MNNIEINHDKEKFTVMQHSNNIWCFVFTKSSDLERFYEFYDNNLNINLIIKYNIENDPEPYTILENCKVLSITKYELIIQNQYTKYLNKNNYRKYKIDNLEI